ncbi:MAG: hypothetical protein ABIJ52_16315 [Pseudomonadota bacterium]|nr:hypothetical protein [Pseudomonadota bacterium]
MEDASSAINIDTLTMPVPEAHRLNKSALIPYLCEHIKGFHGEAEVRKSGSFGKSLTSSAGSTSW